MAKFFKSIFNSAERRKSTIEGDGDEEKTGESPSPMGSRRQLFISRSGRMKQANKKRHSLTLGVYGDTINIDARPNSVQYHVHQPITQTNSVVPDNTKKNRLNNLNNDLDKEVKQTDNTDIEKTFQTNLERKLKTLSLESGNKSPEEEIDNAFEIIDKS